MQAVIQARSNAQIILRPLFTNFSLTSTALRAADRIAGLTGLPRRKQIPVVSCHGTGPNVRSRLVAIRSTGRRRSGAA